MSTFASSTFVGGTPGATAAGHVAAVGGTWVSPTGVPGNAPVYTDADRIRSDAVGGGFIMLPTAGATDGEYAEAIVHTFTSAGGIGVSARCNPSACRAYTAYMVGGNVSVLRLDSPSDFPQVGSSAACVLSAGDHTIRVTPTGTGASVSVAVDVDGVNVLTVADTSASRITTPGSVGFYAEGAISNSTGTHLTSINGVDTAVAAAVAFTAPAAGKIAQLSGGGTGTATIAVAGTYTGTAPDQARLVLDGTSTALSGFDWATIGSASSGNFAHSFTSVPKGGWYNVQVRNSGEGTVTTSGKVGAGVLVALAGQSNAYLWFITAGSGGSSGDSTIAPSPLLRVFGKFNNNAWALGDTTQQNGAIACGNALVAALGCPVGILDGTFDGSGLAVVGNGGQWVGGSGNAYTQFASMVTAAGGKLGAVVWIQGETDAAQGVSQAAHYAALGTLFATMRTDTGQSGLPIILATLARDLTGVTPANREAIKLAQVQKCADTGIYRVERFDLALRSDNIHHTAGAFTVLGTRCARAVLAALGQVATYRGPRITAVRKVSATVFNVLLSYASPTLGTDVVPTSGIDGFRALDGSTPITVNSATHVAGTNVIQLTLASAPSALPTIQYLYGSGAGITPANIARGNDSLALPLEYSGGVAAADAPGVTVVLTSDGTTPIPNLPGVYYAFFAEGRADQLTTPTDKGGPVTPNATTGSLTLTFPNTPLTAGQVGFLDLSTGDGTVTQSPAPRNCGVAVTLA